jgi:hypothetical protein
MAQASGVSAVSFHDRMHQTEAVELMNFIGVNMKAAAATAVASAASAIFSS